jgi:hypothetical protein
MRQTIRNLGACLGLAIAGSALASPVPPFKDELFDYPEPVASLDGGRRLDVPYNEARDIDRRDEVPERRVKRTYVELGRDLRAEERVLATPTGPLRYAQVGESVKGQPILVFVHGRNGDRRLGLNDWTFGGNFNRLKNLLVRSGGSYITVDAERLGDDDAGKVAALLTQLKSGAASPELILTCASMGGQVCWTIATSPTVASIDAMVLLGSDSTLERFDAMRRARRASLPIVMAHGTRDTVYAFDRQLAAFEAVRKRWPTDPVRFIGFDDGNHGTPIRMVDWRDTLNWIAANVSPTAAR